MAGQLGMGDAALFLVPRWRDRALGLMGVEFKGRGRRGDEAIRLMRALWTCERDFEGSTGRSTWRPPSHTLAAAGDLGGREFERAIRRALELGDAWHPSGRTPTTSPA
jgi:alkanesulfonate monooxygenase SsuD/methylene tetrahydromethanopterin reductase-like flavin-dependent oxidoreductase (luciferase family)